MRKIKSLVVMLMIPLFFVACGTPWQAKTTAGYISATTLAGTAENSAKPSCDVGAIPADKCAKLKEIYGNIRQGLVSAGDTAILAFSVTDAVTQKTLLAQFDSLMQAVQANIKQYIELYQDLSKTYGRKALPKNAISPELLTILINVFTAIVQNIPNIIQAIDAWNINAVDIPGLTVQIQTAQANLPVW